MKLPMIIPIVTNVNRPNTIFMAGAAAAMFPFVSFDLRPKKEQNFELGRD